MSNTIDSRVVEMKFNNADFQRGVSSTMKSLDDLKTKLNFDGAKKGISDLSAAGKNFSLEGMGKGIEDLASKFRNLSVIGVTALATITNKAVNAGLQLAKSLTIGPIGQGFADYNTKLTSVSTIMNATGANIKTVESYFKQLDTYADKTIFNLTDMTGAFAKFTNAGLSMDKSVPAIKGIANMVALAGQGAESAQIAMYNLSQSIAGGFLTTIDYKSLNLANVATKEWKNQMIAGAVAAGTLKKGTDGLYHVPGAKKAFTDASLFTEGLSEQWATTKVLTKVLGDYGDTTTAIGKKAQAAAQNVKSLPMMFTTLKEAIGTQWTDSFQFMLGNVTESTSLFTSLTNTLSGVLSASGNARNHLLSDWKAIGGRKAFIDGIIYAWRALIAVVKPIRDAFREVFPPTTGQQLTNLSVKIREFARHLMIGKETADNLHRTFKGVFSLLKIGVMIVSSIIGAMFGLTKAVGGGTGGFLAITATIGDFITKLQEWLSKTGAVKVFFAILASPLSLLGPMIGLVSGLAKAFSALLSGDVSGFTSKFTAAFGVVGAYFDGIRTKIDNFLNLITSALGNIVGFFFNLSQSAQNSGNAFVAVWAARLASLAGHIFSFVQTAKQHIDNFVNTLKSIGVGGANFFSSFSLGAFGGILTAVGNLTGKFHDLRGSMDMGSAFSNISSGTSILGDSLSKMSVVGSAAKDASSGIISALGNIGTAFAPVLTGLRDFFTTVVSKITEFVKNMNFQDVLALFNTGVFILMYRAVTNVSKAISGTFNQLTSTLKSMQQDVKANVILKIAIAVSMLVASVLVLSRIDPKALGTAVGALALLFTQLGIMLKVITKIDPRRMASTGTGLVLMATSIRIIVGAIKTMGNMSIGSLVQGMTALAVIFGLLAAAMTSMTAGLPGARAVIIIAAALAILTPVLLTLGLLPYEVLGKGLVMVAATLLVLAVAANAMTAALPGASAILIIAAALLILSPALVAFGLMPWENIGKAMVVLGATLLLLVAAASAMTAALPGAAAILILAGALAILAPALIAFGLMSWGGIAKGLVTLAGVFAIFVAAMYLLTPVIVILSLFSGSLLVMGAGLLLAGAGMLLFSTALAALAVSGAAGFVVLVAGIHSFLMMVPLIAQQFGLALVAIAVVLGQAAPRLIQAFVAIVIAMLKGIQKLAPEIVKTLGIMLMALVNEIAKRGPQLYDAAMRMIRGFLKVIGDHVVEMTKLGMDLMTKFMNAISARLGPLVDAGVKLIITFINSLSDALDKHSEEMGRAGGRLAVSIVTGMIKGLAGMGGQIIQAAKDMANKLPWWVKKTLGIHSPSKEFEKIGIFINQGLIKGLTGSSADVQKAYDTMKVLLHNAMTNASDEMTAHAEKIKKLTAARDADNLAILRAQQAYAAARASKNPKDDQVALDHLNALIAKRNEHNAAIRNETAAMGASKAEKLAAAAGYNELTRHLGDETRALQALAVQYDAFTVKIEAANKTLDDAIKTRDDYYASINTQYDKLPDITADTTLTSYITDLQKRAVDTTQFAEALQQLRNLGLSDEMYKELLSKGLDAMPFVQEIIKGGAQSIIEINNAGTALGNAAKALGSTASVALYQAGVDAAKGLVDGLKSQQAAIAAEMAKIAAAVEAVLAAKLKIKSPSRVMSKLGEYIGQGLALGMRNSVPVVEAAADHVGGKGIEAMKKSIFMISDLFDQNMDLQPTITPVLDLSSVQKEALRISSMLTAEQISVNAAYSQAKDVSAAYRSNQDAALADSTPTDIPPTNLTFVQNNTSPKALSSAEIYRQTNNQLSKVKGALTGANSN